VFKILKLYTAPFYLIRNLYFATHGRNFIIIDPNTPRRQETLTPALANTLQAKQIKATQLKMQLLQKESDVRLARKAKEVALKRRRDEELY